MRRLTFEIMKYTRAIRLSVLLLGILTTMSGSVFAQQDELEELKRAFKVLNQERIERTEKFSKENNIPIMNRLDDGTVIYLKDVINGIPQFITTDNQGARATTGADKIGVGGELGLDLDGSGINVAIWDGGTVRPTHQELIGRVSQADGSTSLNFHATHVAGTILSQGINESAKGMATNASALTFDFANDDDEMLSRSVAGEDGTVISNHSYGLVTGWSNGSWNGDVSISDQEDYRFGFYSGGARLWDQIAYNDEYYTIVKSAGNDRGDSGDGPFPPDGPYDIISDNGNAKNIFTIGAVRKATNYSSPEDVVMSSFSGWGPTDDGRIKPDFVAAGVGIMSTFETSDVAYGNLQGTSMSAPNAAGTFVLLQQLHKKLSGGRLMKSSSLKGLVAHTVREAGKAPGPDYEFGWGLINAVGAAEQLIRQNGDNIMFKEFDLANGQSVALDIVPEVGSQVTATICWIDPPGTVPTRSLDPSDTILVNDLDLKIYNDDETNLPWILDPARPAIAAAKGDNFRDNIEKVEFEATSNQYTLEISHKGALEGSQNFTLVLTYKKDQSQDKYLYWVGGSDSQFSSPNWAVSSGGESSGDVPDENTTLIFDNNFATEGEVSTINLTEGDAFGGIVFLSKNPVELVLSSDITVTGNILTNENVKFSGSGTVYLSSDNQITVSTPTLFENVDVVFDEFNELIVNGDFVAKSLTINSGETRFNSEAVELGQLDLSNEVNKELYLDDVELKITNSFKANSETTTISDINATYVLAGEAVLFEHNNYVSSAKNHRTSGSVQVVGDYTADNFSIAGNLEFTDSSYIKSLSMARGSALKLQKHLEFDSISVISNSGEGTISISSDVKGTVAQTRHQKICLDDFEIINVDFVGLGAISIGSNGALSNSEGWSTLNCDDVIFSDFTFKYNCVDSRVKFTNKSSGNFSSSQWNFNGLSESTDENAEFVFTEAGTYEVTLTVSGQEFSNSYTRQIEISENDLEELEIILSNDRFFSLKAGNSYQWYRNDAPIDGATDRTYFHNDVAGEYFVVAFADNCNRTSNILSITVLGLDSELEDEILISPNPTSGLIKIELAKGVKGEVLGLEVLSISGKLLISQEEANQVDLSGLSNGVYFLKVNMGDKSITRKIVKE